MIDPKLSLAFSIHSNPGIYALLLGSGLSRPAGILTGWEVVLDLIYKMANIMGERCEPNPEAWYKNKFKKEPDYSEILDEIAKSQAERSQLLRGYFEPNEEEREQGLKMPTNAHKAIANLVVNGFMKVIITTNFDRLMEKALEDVGIAPTVISTPDAAEGALPITHAKCTIIKVHGDYIDTRIKNTPPELKKYDKRINQLLDRIFDEFGLIVCAWSAEWDVALRAALERCKSHRFTTYWTAKSEPKDKTKQLVNLRRAKVIKIKDADSFFMEVEQKVTALIEMDRPHPLSPKVAVERLKKYLPDERYRIQLNDLVMQEANKIYEEFAIGKFLLDGPFNEEKYRNRIQHYESLTEILKHLIVAGCYWGEKEHEDLWVGCIQRIIIPSTARSGFDEWIKLRRYPALVLIYAGGISSIVARRYNNLAALLTKTREFFINKEVPLTLYLAPTKVMDKHLAERIFKMERAYTPVNNHLEEVLREPFREYLPDDDQYRKFFDRFEYLFALVYTDLFEKQENRFWAPIGCFGWRYRDEPEKHISTEIELESIEEGDNWPPIKAGLFDGSVERFQYIKKGFYGFFSQIHWF